MNVKYETNLLNGNVLKLLTVLLGCLGLLLLPHLSYAKKLACPASQFAAGTSSDATVLLLRSYQGQVDSYCSAFMIADGWALTAAHCILPMEQVDRFGSPEYDIEKMRFTNLDIVVPGYRKTNTPSQNKAHLKIATNKGPEYLEQYFAATLPVEVAYISEQYIMHAKAYNQEIWKVARQGQLTLPGMLMDYFLGPYFTDTFQGLYSEMSKLSTVDLALVKMQPLSTNHATEKRHSFLKLASPLEWQEKSYEQENQKHGIAAVAEGFKSGVFTNSTCSPQTARLRPRLIRTSSKLSVQKQSLADMFVTNPLPAAANPIFIGDAYVLDAGDSGGPLKTNIAGELKAIGVNSFHQSDAASGFKQNQFTFLRDSFSAHLQKKYSGFAPIYPQVCQFVNIDARVDALIQANCSQLTVQIPTPLMVSFLREQTASKSALEASFYQLNQDVSLQAKEVQ